MSVERITNAMANVASRRAFTGRAFGAGRAAHRIKPFVRPSGSLAQASSPARALGAFVHGAPQNPALLDQFTTDIGRQPAIVSWYEAWGSQNAVTGEIIRLDLLRAVADRGAIPLITWEPWDPGAGVDQPGYRLAIIARGDFDAYINSWAYRLAAYGGPVWLRFGHEMNAPWYPWGVAVNGNTPADYVAAWHHLRARFLAAGATNVRWVWCVDAPSIDAHPADAAYPGDDSVDLVALDGYNWGTSTPGSTWQTLPQLFASAYERTGAQANRPVIIAETACAEQGGDKADWIRQGFAAIQADFPRLTAVCWFNEIASAADWRVESSPASLAAFKEVASQTVWHGQPET